MGFSLFVIVLSAICVQVPAPTLVRSTPIEGKLQGEVILEKDTTESAGTGQLHLRVLVRTSAGYASVSNPFWDRRYQLPGYVAVFDERGNFVGHILANDGKKPEIEQKTQLTGDMIAGTLVSVPLSDETIIEKAEGTEYVRKLGPGAFQLQAVYTQAFVTPGDSNHDVLAASPPLTVRIPEASNLANDRRVPNAARVHVSLGGAPAGASAFASNEDVSLGQHYALVATIENRSEVPLDVFNPLSYGFRTNRGCEIEVTDESGAVVGDLLKVIEGSGFIVGNMSLPPMAIAGARFDGLVAGRVQAGLFSEQLPAGTYHLRAFFKVNEQRVGSVPVPIEFREQLLP